MQAGVLPSLLRYSAQMRVSLLIGCSLGNQKHNTCVLNMWDYVVHENPTIKGHKNFILPAEGLWTTAKSWEEGYRIF